MRWKWIALSGLVLIVVLAASGYFVLRTYDYNKLKPRITRLAAESTGRKLTLDGEISFEFGLSPALTVTDVALANASWASDPQMITARRIEARVRLLPLLFGNVEVRYLSLSGVMMVLETDAAGHRNWEFTAPAGAAPRFGLTTRMHISVEDVRAADLALTFRDEKVDRVTRFNLAGLDISRLSTPDFLGLKLKADYNGQPVELSGRIGRIQRILSGQRFPLALAGQLSNAAVSIEGAIGDVRELGGIDLNLRITGKNIQKLGLGYLTGLPQTDAFELSGHMSGSGQSPALENVSGNVSAGGFNFTVSGRVGNLVVLQDIKLHVKGSGKDLAQVGAIIGQPLPSTAEVALQGDLIGSAEALALQNIRGQARRGSLSLAADGEIGDLPAFGRVDLRLKALGKDLAQAGAIVGRKLPLTDEFSVEGSLTGSGRELGLQNIRGQARRGSLRLTADGTIGDLLEFEGVDLRLSGTGKNLAQAESLIGRKLPPTDVVALEGRLTGSRKMLALSEIHGRASRGSLSLAIDGKVGELPAFRRVDLQLKADGKNLAAAGEIVGQKLPPTDEFFMAGHLTGSADVLSLQDVQSWARRGSINLEATGAVKNLRALEGMNLGLKARGKELAEIGPLVGKTLPEWGPFDFSGHLSGSPRFISMDDLRAVIDQSDLNGRAKVEFRKRPKITLVLESSLLDLTALLKNLKQEEKEPVPASGDLEARLFSNDPLPLDFLKQVDADVRLNAKNIRASDANFEFGRLALTLENGDLNIGTLKATYKQTRISGNFHLYPESPARVAANFLVQDFDLGGLLQELHISDQVRSHLDIAVDVNSRGGSLHDLMADLDGSLGAVMGEGYLTHYLDLLSVGLTRKVLHFWGHHKKGGEIKCAVVQFDISRGLAASKAFVFDTEAGVLTGEGDIDLAKEQVNFLLVPDPRYPSFLDFWTKLRVSGPIMDPKVRPDKFSLLSKGAKALSALVIGPLGLLAPFVNLGAHKAHPCSVYSIGH